MTTTKGWVEVPVDGLNTAPWNYKKTSAEMDVIAQKLEENIKRNGVVENLLVRELPEGGMEVVNGNHRLHVLRKLGIEKVMVFNLGNITLAQAGRIAVETNETRFPADDLLLGQLLKTIINEFPIDDLATTFNKTPEELTDLVKLTEFDFDALPEGDVPDDLGAPSVEQDSRQFSFLVEESADQEVCRGVLAQFGMTGPWDASAAFINAMKALANSAAEGSTDADDHEEA